MADAYLKIKDNGAQGLALERETEEELKGNLGIDALKESLKSIEDYTYGDSEEKTGDVVEFDGCAENASLKKCLVELPYSENGYTSVRIRRTGKNVWGGTQLLGDFKRMIPSGTVNENLRTITFTAAAAFSGKYGVKYKENTQYRFVITLSNTSAGSNATNLRILYTDGTYSSSFSKALTSEKQTITRISESGKTVKSLGKINQGGSTTLYADECGVFELSMYDGFEDYAGTEYENDWGALVGTIYGGTVDVANGIIYEKYDNAGNEIEPIVHTIEPTDISTIGGFNVLWCIEGEITAICKVSLEREIDKKQDKLTFDETPTQNSENPVTSNGIYEYVESVKAQWESDNVQEVVNQYLEENPPTAVEDNSLTSNKMTSEMKGWIRRSVINVKDYGAAGDGTTDDSRAIVAAVAALPISHGVLYFPPGVYIHGDGLTGEDGTGNDYTGDPNVGRDIRLMFNGYSDLIIYGDSAEIRSNDNNGECPHNSIINLYSCNHVVICGLTINGRREERGSHLGDGDAYNKRGNIHIYGGDDIIIDRVRSINSMMDGAYLGVDNNERVRNLKILNSEFSNSYRNGLSVSAVEWAIIENCVCDNNGTNGDSWSGHDPRMGISIERDYPSYPPVHVTVRNCRAFGNAGVAAISVTKSYSTSKAFLCEDVTIEGCSADNKISDSSSGYSKHINMINNRLFNAGIRKNNGGIVRGNTIVYSASKLANAQEYKAILCESNSDILLIEGNYIYCDAENIAENIFCNLGIDINNSEAVFINNVFQNPLWGQGQNPIIVNARKNEGNILYQKVTPAGYNVIPES